MSILSISRNFFCFFLKMGYGSEAVFSSFNPPLKALFLHNNDAREVFLSELCRVVGVT